MWQHRIKKPRLLRSYIRKGVAKSLKYASLLNNKTKRIKSLGELSLSACCCNLDNRFKIFTLTITQAYFVTSMAMYLLPQAAAANLEEHVKFQSIPGFKGLQRNEQISLYVMETLL